MALQFARNLAEAKGLMAAAVPDVLVLDRMLDGVDSLHAIAELRSSGFAGPVLVVSVIADETAPLEAGATAFLCKPIDAGVLRETLAQLLRRASGKTVLLVDDDEINRYVLREALQPFSLTLVEARSGREALALTAANTFAAVFLDVSMPGMTGPEVLRELRSSGNKVPVIIHTSKDLSTEELSFLGQMDATLFPKQALGEPLASDLLRAVLQEVGVV